MYFTRIAPIFGLGTRVPETPQASSLGVVSSDHIFVGGAANTATYTPTVLSALSSPGLLKRDADSCINPGDVATCKLGPAWCDFVDCASVPVLVGEGACGNSSYVPMACAALFTCTPGATALTDAGQGQACLGAYAKAEDCCAGNTDVDASRANEMSAAAGFALSRKTFVGVIALSLTVAFFN